MDTNKGIEPHTRVIYTLAVPSNLTNPKGTVEGVSQINRTKQTNHNTTELYKYNLNLFWRVVLDINIKYILRCFAKHDL